MRLLLAVQPIQGDTCDHIRTYPSTCNIPSMSIKLPVPTSLSTLQSHIPNRNIVIATTTVLTGTICFHNSALSCFILNGTFEMLQKQETLFIEYTNI